MEKKGMKKQSYPVRIVRRWRRTGAAPDWSASSAWSCRILPGCTPPSRTAGSKPHESPSLATIPRRLDVRWTSDCSAPPRLVQRPPRDGTVIRRGEDDVKVSKLWKIRPKSYLNVHISNQMIAQIIADVHLLDIAVMVLHFGEHLNLQENKIRWIWSVNQSIDQGIKDLIGHLN